MDQVLSHFVVILITIRLYNNIIEAQIGFQIILLYAASIYQVLSIF